MVACTESNSLSTPRNLRIDPMRCFAVILLFSAGLFSGTLPWTPANFRGIVLGTSHRIDAVRILGAPDAATRTASGEEIVYRARGEHKGDLTLRVDRSGVITDIEEAFPVAIPRTRIYKEFGNSPLTEHFSMAKCEGGALYRDPRGNIELTLYPARGIALWPDEYGYDFAAMHYLARQSGLAHAPACVTKH